MLSIAIGSDHAGFELKQTLRSELERQSIPYHDFGTNTSEAVDYPDIAINVGNAVANHESDLGILICGSGIGMSIVANKISGVRAALCMSVDLASMSRRHNNANILVLAARFVETDTAIDIVNEFLNTSFESGGRHERRVNKIHKLTGR